MPQLPRLTKIAVSAIAAAILVAIVVVVLALHFTGGLAVFQWRLQPDAGQPDAGQPDAKPQDNPCAQLSIALPSSVAVPAFTLVAITNPVGTAEDTDDMLDDMLGAYTAVQPMAWVSAGLNGLWTNGSYYIAYQTLDGGASYITRVAQYSCSKSSQGESYFFETAPAAFDATAPLGSIGTWMMPADETVRLLYIVSHNIHRDVALNILSTVGTVLSSSDTAPPSLSTTAQKLADMLSDLLAALMGSADEEAQMSKVRRLAAALTETYPTVALEDLALSVGYVFNAAAVLM